MYTSEIKFNFNITDLSIKYGCIDMILISLLIRMSMNFNDNFVINGCIGNFKSNFSYDDQLIWYYVILMLIYIKSWQFWKRYLILANKINRQQ